MATETRTALSTQSATPAGEPPAARRDQPAGKLVWQINMRRLLWSAGVAVVVVPALYFWHDYQHARHAQAILANARRLYDKQNWNAASAAFHQYLRLVPDDAQALIQRAQTFEKLPMGKNKRQQAASLYLEAFRANPGRYDLLLRRAELLYESGRYGEAQAEAEQVQTALASQSTGQSTGQTTATGDTQPDPVVADRLYAAAYRKQTGTGRRHSVDEAVGVFEKAVQAHAGDIELSTGLAELLAGQTDSLVGAERDAVLRHADKVIDDMVALNRGDAKALLARYEFQTAQAQRDRSRELRGKYHDTRDQDLATLLQTAPDNPEVLNTAATAFAEKAVADTQKADLETDTTVAAELKAAAGANRAQARAHASRLMEVAPAARRSYIAAATLYFRWGEWEAAIQTLKEGLLRCGENDIDLNLNLLQMYLTAGNSQGARDALKRVEPFARRMLPYLEQHRRSRLVEDLELADARIQDLEGKTASALPQLKRMAVSVTDRDDARETLEERVRRWRLLAAAYSRVGQHDLAAAAYDQLIHLDPFSQEYRMLAASAWGRSGDSDRALKRFEEATAGGPEARGAWLPLAEARFAQQLRNPAAESRDWRGVDAALKQARRYFGNSVAVVLQEASVALARNERPAALAQLKELAAREDLAPAQLPRLAALLQTAGDSALADALLERFQNSGGSPAAVALMKADLLGARGDTAGAIETLAQALEQVHDRERGSILRRLINLEIGYGSISSARRRLRELRQTAAPELWVYETAGDLAIVEGNFVELEECEHELAALGGAASTLSQYFRVIRLLQKTSDKASPMVEVNRLIGEIDAVRPSWPRIHVLRGLVAEYSNRLDDAVKTYELALQKGDQSFTTLYRLVETLYRQNRVDEAARYMLQMGQLAALSDELTSQAMAALLRPGTASRALSLARAAAELRPGDPLSQLWYAQSLALSDKTSHAEATFQKAIKLAPTDLRTRSGLVWFYARLKRLTDARQALDDLVKNVELSPLDRDLVVARGFDLMGDRQRADQSYTQLLAAYPTNVKLHEEAGRFYLRFNQEKALEVYQQALKLDPKSTDARRQLALLWGLRGNDTEMGRALELLVDKTGTEGAPGDDRRLQAALLIARGGDAHSRQAVELLTGLIKSNEKPEASDRLLLARAYTDLAEVDLAQEQYETLLATQNDPLYQALFVRFLLRHDRLALADQWLKRLEQADATNQRTLEMRVDWLKRSQRSAEIESTVDRFLAGRLKLATTDRAQAALLRYGAELFAAAGLDDPAEKKLRELARRFPASYESLATWLAERGRVAEALELCLEKSSGVDPVVAALPLVRVLVIAANAPSQSAFDPSPAEAVIAAAGADRQASPQFLLQLGVLRTMQSRNAEAVSIYERILSQEPDNPVVLNNLAVVLVEIAERKDEALSCIEKVIAASPDSLEFLDTKGLVLVGLGRFTEAREIFDRLCDTNPKNAHSQLHLAMTLQHLGDISKSREHVRLAIDNQVEKQFLTTAERRFVREALAAADGPEPPASSN